MARGARSSSSVVDTTLLAICLLSSLVVLFLPGTLRDRAAGALRRSVVSPLAELQRRAELSRAAFVSYDARMTQRGAQARAASEAESLRTENDHLRKLLGLARRLGWGFVTAEAIPNQLTGELVQTQILRTFMVTAGGRAGVAPFTPVVTAEGLVGMVQEVDPAMSLAISYLHEDFRVSAMTTDASAFGIVQPHLGRGPERGLLELRGVPFRSQLKAGTLVVSSGLGATYPRGIAIGSVLREVQTPEKWARTYLLQPVVPLASVGPVLLLSKPRVNAGVDSVWTNVAAADSAARAAAAAGDSLVRANLLREAAARRAALDSLIPDSLRTDSTRADTTAAPAAPATPRPAPAAVPPTGGAAGGVTPATPPRPRPTVRDSGAPRPTPPAATPRPTTPRPTTPRPTAPSTTPPAAAPTRPRPDTGARPVTPRPAPARPTVPPPGAGAARA
ncbi:MAG: rod shape-determining protein MreC [Gemmatirosa sp.]